MMEGDGGPGWGPNTCSDGRWVTDQGVVMSATEMTVTSLALPVEIQALAEASVHLCLDSS